MKLLIFRPVLYLLVLGLNWACTEKKATPSRKELIELNLKAGRRLSCGPANPQLGAVQFPVACSAANQADFDLGLKLLHSFEYDEAEKVFAGILYRQPDCRMAYWGVAMSNFHPLWTPPSEPELRKGAAALHLARALPAGPAREAAYLAAVGAYYQDWVTVDHPTRCRRFEQAMEKLAAAYPADREATVFYALALTAAASPADTTYARQKKAGAILSTLYAADPTHPGVVHYLIHAYDTPTLAARALPAARRYAALAPSSAHALHMPSHIFTRLGLWQEGISANLTSVAAAQCYAEQAGLKGHWDEELHGLDYLTYAYLQTGDNARARQQWEYVKGIREVSPVNFKVAYAYAAVPARYVLENKQWPAAARLESHEGRFPWAQYPWQRAMLHFTRLLGAIHTQARPAAHTELQALTRLHEQLLAEKDEYKARQVANQLTMGTAWLRLLEGRQQEALVLMTRAADEEDHTEKHPVTPGEILPARELLADMLLAVHQPAAALTAYEASLRKHPNRLNSVYGAGLAAEQSGDLRKAGHYYRHLLTFARPTGSTRPRCKPLRLSWPGSRPLRGCGRRGVGLPIPGSNAHDRPGRYRCF
ncbi:hypothetical protein [Hymenobacter cellulosilyticus]|uniref:Tetratricopeptide repeat protein n=1 Tax=Hymenobacter cellulosilyticus TaxID=2932248 RepID=A0A8T9PZG5_9BACT|nr:hypothetical protein [Hymenobacter cellulosilyticus]UOQ70145.1 hypothetical protein MUN79_15375 [Hymenobacter cellulosilyticus]